MVQDNVSILLAHQNSSVSLVETLKREWSVQEVRTEEELATSLGEATPTLVLWDPQLGGAHLLGGLPLLFLSSAPPPPEEWDSLDLRGHVVDTEPEHVAFNIRATLSLCKTSKELSDSRAKATQENDAKSNFLGALSHEVRTPLSAILGFTELLLSEDTSKIQRDYLTRVERNAQYLLRLVNDLLDQQRLRTSQLKIRVRPFCPRRLVEDVCDALSVEANRKGLTLEWEVQEVPEALESDPVRLKQILMNLINNAIKFSTRGRVRVRGQYQAPTLLFDVYDEGMGLESEVITNLFLPYHRSRKGAECGAGLGLYLSKQFAQALGGDVRLVSTDLGRGSHFQASVQAQPFTRQAPEPHTKPSTPSKPLAGLHLLLVEDDEDSCLLESQVLRFGGATERCAGTAKEAMELLQKEKFDGVLLDLQLPDMDGLTLVRQLRKQDKKTLVLALSAHAAADKKREALEAGCNGYLTKPMRFAELVAKLARADISVPNATP